MTRQVPPGLEATLSRSSHPYYYWESLNSTPEGLALVLEESSRAAIRSAATALAGKDFVHCIGCGTSYYNAMAAAYALQALAGQPACAQDAFEFVAYPPPNLKNSVVLAISHSGKTAAAVEGLEMARSLGVTTVAFSDDAGSPMARVAEYSVQSPNPEVQGPKNRSYVASLLRANLLAAEVARLRGQELPDTSVLDRSPEIAGQVLEGLRPAVEDLARNHAGHQRVVVIGGGPQWITANEANLKFIETALIHSDAWEMEEAVHGTWMCLKEGDLVILLGLRGPSLEKARLLTRGFKTLGVQIWAISDDPAALSEADHLTLLPTGLPEWATPMFAILPLYQFIYFYTLARGLHPDRAPYGDPRYVEARKIIRQSTKTGVA